MDSREYRKRRMGRAARPEPEKFASGPGLWLAGEGIVGSSVSRIPRAWLPVLAVAEDWLLERLRPDLGRGVKGAGALVEEVFPRRGQCCEENVVRLVSRAREAGCRSVLAAGGGKCLDAGKLAAERLEMPVATIPSSAATCAAASGIAAKYTCQGEFLEIVDLSRPPDLCVVDLDLIGGAPPELLSAGMADTLAKWLEWAPLTENDGETFGRAAGLGLARQAYDIVLMDGERALDALPPTGGLNHGAFNRVVEANILLSAMASVMGSGPAAAAHSLCNGLSLLPPLRLWLHGVLVGIGLLFQDRLLRELGQSLPGIDEVGQREDRLRRLNLPIRLPLDLLNPPARARVVEKMLAPDETIHLIPGVESLGPERLEKILLELCA